jgi:RNA polymerase sigma-70 factor, ECF subfamily
VEAAYLTQFTQTIAGVPEFPQADSQFVSEHLQRTFLQIYRIVRNVADAQDLTQDTFIKALRYRDQLKDEQKAANWLSRIATNTAIDFIRRKQSACFVEINDELRRHDDNPERIMKRTETSARLDAALRRLTPREREALLLRDVEGLPAEQVAVLLDCSKATVRSHIAHARIKLRQYLLRFKR